MYKLIIANKNYSSWSLRAWLYLKESKIAFEETRIPLFTEDWREQVGRYTPAGRVPVLLDNGISVWDSMAIMAYLQEKHPQAIGWPEKISDRAYAHSISAEMHSGFMALRDELPQNIRMRKKLDIADLSETCRAQIRRIGEIWSDCRTRHGDMGPWLFGKLSIADVMYAPVALRFRTYGIILEDRPMEFVEAVEDLDSVSEWRRASREEKERLSFIDDLMPASASPLTLG